VAPLPKINLDAYKSCFPPRSRSREVAFAGISVTFGMPLPSGFQHNFTLGFLMHPASRTLGCGIDLIAFLIILVTAGGSIRTGRFPGIPDILDAILRDATVYFLLIFASQLVLFLFLFLAPVGDPYWIQDRLILFCSSSVHFQLQIQLMPGV
jgi:hypothetical protein